MPGNPAQQDSQPRNCIACGYSLQGLGVEPRCPECGLLNVPDGYRRQVWELVDSRPWFYSDALRPFKRRLPGWWWSLDRPGDVRRALHYAAFCVAASVLIVFVTAAIAGAVLVRVTLHYTYIDPTDPTATTRSAGYTEFTSCLDRCVGVDDSGLDWDSYTKYNAILGTRTTVRWLWAWNTRFFALAIPVAVGLVLSWALPALVGLWTQIRKGLPDFARAPRTIIAASCYEAHRLLYLAIAFVAWAAVDTMVRTQYTTPAAIWSGTLSYSIAAMALGLALFAACGWIGPLRSDYTRQLIRSRRHLFRVLVMYAVGLPAVFAMAVSALFELWFYL